MLNCFYDCYKILYKVYGEEKSYIKQALLSTDIEEKNRSITTKICYGVLDRDIELGYYISKLVDKSPKLPVKIVLKISMYCILYMKKKDYAIIDNAVELVKKMGKGGVSGFVNAVLRKFDREKENILLPTEDAEYISVKYSYPQFAVKKLLDVYGRERTESILTILEPKTTLVFYNADGEEYLKEKGIKYEKTPFDNVFNVFNFTRNEDYDKGVYTFMSLGSVAVCDVIEKADNFLDCCAAPGGKSILLSKKMGEIVSTDIHEHRVKLIEEYKKRTGTSNVTAKCADAKVYNSEYDGKFDGVLLDAPCSSLGVFLDNPDVKLNRTEEDLKSISREQRSILSNVSKYVKVGGSLYYSTCSILDEENIDVIKEFINLNDNYLLEKIDSKLMHEDKDGANAFLPDISGGAGFFVAKLKRIK